MNNEAMVMIQMDKLNGYRTSHVFHFILSLLTAGLWIPIWGFMALNNWVGRASTRSKIKKLAK